MKNVDEQFIREHLQMYRPTLVFWFEFEDGWPGFHETCECARDDTVVRRKCYGDRVRDVELCQVLWKRNIDRGFVGRHCPSMFYVWLDHEG